MKRFQPFCDQITNSHNLQMHLTNTARWLCKVLHKNKTVMFWHMRHAQVSSCFLLRLRFSADFSMFVHFDLSDPMLILVQSSIGATFYSGLIGVSCWFWCWKLQCFSPQQELSNWGFCDTECGFSAKTDRVTSLNFYSKWHQDHNTFAATVEQWMFD